MKCLHWRSDSLDRSEQVKRSKISYFCILFSGAHTLWELPVLTMRFGGVVFILIYLIMFLLLGTPMLLLEMTMGQYSALSPTKLYRNLCPVSTLKQTKIMAKNNLVELSVWSVPISITLVINNNWSILCTVNVILNHTTMNHTVRLHWTFDSNEWIVPVNWMFGQSLTIGSILCNVTHKTLYKSLAFE